MGSMQPLPSWDSKVRRVEAFPIQCALDLAWIVHLARVTSCAISLLGSTIPGSRGECGGGVRGGRMGIIAKMCLRVPGRNRSWSPDPLGLQRRL